MVVVVLYFIVFLCKWGGLCKGVGFILVNDELKIVGVIKDILIV